LRHSIAALVLGCTALLGAGAEAQTKPFVYYVPAIARTGGLNQSYFVSNVRVFNKGGAEAKVDAFFLSTADNTAAVAKAFTVAPNRAAAYDDVLQSLFGLSGGGGALRLESDQPLIASSHLQNVNSLCPDQGATTGQYLGGIPRSAAATHQRLPHLTQDETHRANFGVVNTTGSEANLTIVLRDLDNGSVISEAIARVPPHGWAQFNAIVDQFFVFDPVPNGMLEVTSDVPVITYLSLIDNVTNDAFTVIGEPD
jgi:hypothetical protein